jgi:hypothetical protein
MEAPDMNTPSTPSEDPLETLLRKNSEPIADNGFSARVLAVLPPPVQKPRVLPNRRVIACGLGALSGLVWGLMQSGLPRANDLAAFASVLEGSMMRIAATLADPWVLLLGALVISSLVFAYAREIAAKLS